MYQKRKLDFYLVCLVLLLLFYHINCYIVMLEHQIQDLSQTIKHLDN